MAKSKPTKKRKPTKAAEPAFRVYPKLADLRRGKLGVENFEDTLTLAIEFDHDLSNTEKAAIAKLYAAWTKRIVKESREADDDLEDDFTRFDTLFVGDKGVQGGASRFIAAHESCAWLVGELAKQRGVVSVAFGDPPDDGAPLTTAPSVDDEPPPELAKLEVIGKDGVRQSSLCFTITLYGTKPLQSSPAALLAAWRRFLALVPPGRLALWGTETTAPMNKKRVTESTLGLLEKWVAKGAPKREYLAFEIDDGPTYSHAPRWRFNVWSKAGEQEDAHFVRLAMPIRLGLERADEMASLACELFASNTFRSGIAGPCWETGPEDEPGHTHAVELAALYPAIEIAEIVNDSLAVGRDGIKNVGWLTLLDDRFVAELGGTKRLAELPVQLEPAGKGVMLRAGPVPTLEAGGGESAVFAAVATLVARTLPRLRWLSTPRDQDLHTTAFKLRFAPWPELAVARAHAGTAEALLAAAQRANEPDARAAMRRCLAAITELRGLRTDTPVVADHPEARRELVDNQLRHLYGYIQYAAAAAASSKHRELAIHLYESALAQPGAPATLYGELQIRDDPYVLGGIIPTAIAANDRPTLERHLAGAAACAADEPAIHHALARAYTFLGDHERAIDHVELAQKTYEDAKELKTDSPLRALAKHPRFIAAFKNKRK